MRGCAREHSSVSICICICMIVGQHRSRHMHLSSVSAVRYNEAAHHSLATKQWGAVLAPHTMTCRSAFLRGLIYSKEWCGGSSNLLLRPGTAGRRSPRRPPRHSGLYHVAIGWKIRFTLLCSLYLLQNAISSPVRIISLHRPTRHLQYRSCS